MMYKFVLLACIVAVASASIADVEKDIAAIRADLASEEHHADDQSMLSVGAKTTTKGGPANFAIKFLACSTFDMSENVDGKGPKIYSAAGVRCNVDGGFGINVFGHALKSKPTFKSNKVTSRSGDHTLACEILHRKLTTYTREMKWHSYLGGFRISTAHLLRSKGSIVTFSDRGKVRGRCRVATFYKGEPVNAQKQITGERLKLKIFGFSSALEGETVSASWFPNPWISEEERKETGKTNEIHHREVKLGPRFEGTEMDFGPAPASDKILKFMVSKTHKYTSNSESHTWTHAEAREGSVTHTFPIEDSDVRAEVQIVPTYTDSADYSTWEAPCRDHARLTCKKGSKSVCGGRGYYSGQCYGNAWCCKN